MDPTKLSISLEGLLRELGLAWQRLSLYQEGHPARHEVVLRVHTVLSALTAARGGLAVGVAQDGFVGKDRKVDGGPALRLAESLYRRHVAVVRFAEETTVEDLKTLLQVVPRGRPMDDEPPLWDLLAERGVTAVRLEPLDLEYVEAGAEDEEVGGGGGSGSLWDGLLRAVLDELEPGDAAGATEAEAEVPGGGRSLHGLLAQIERSLARRGISLSRLGERPVAGSSAGSAAPAAPGSGPGAAGQTGTGSRSGSGSGSASGVGAGSGAAALTTRLGTTLGIAVASRLGAGGRRTGHDVAELLKALPDALSEVVLDRALSELVGPSGGAGSLGAPERAAGFSALVEGLPSVQVIAALRRIRSAGIPFSASVVALVDSLIAHAGRAAPTEMSPAELAGELAALFRADDPDRRLPMEEELDRLALDLARLPPDTPPDPGAVALRVATLTEHRQRAQLSLTLLDLLERPFLKRPAQEAVARRLGEVFRSLLAEGALALAMRIPERLQELRAAEAGTAAAEIGFAELRRPESAAAFLERPDELPASAAATALRLAELLGDGVLDDLLEAMCEEDDLSRRRHIFDLMVSLGRPIVPRAQALLEDERWYVQRNMISLLRRVGGGLSIDTLGRGLGHDDPRVRLEALRGLGQGKVSPELIEQAVSDPDPKVAQAAVTAVGTYGLTAGIGPLLVLLERRGPFGRNRELRLLALETLGKLGDPAALEGIAHFLRPWFSSIGAEERRAAYASLAGYPPESRRPWLEKGRWSSDPTVRRICREMLRSAEGEA